MDINTADINNINLEDNDFGTMIDVRLVACVMNLSNVKHLNSGKELMLVAWHPTRWWDWCVSQEENK